MLKFILCMMILATIYFCGVGFLHVAHSFGY